MADIHRQWASWPRLVGPRFWMEEVAEVVMGVVITKLSCVANFDLFCHRSADQAAVEDLMTELRDSTVVPVLLNPFLVSSTPAAPRLPAHPDHQADLRFPRHHLRRGASGHRGHRGRGRLPHRSHRGQGLASLTVPTNTMVCVLTVSLFSKFVV
jgi:hypothetical protein